MLQKLVQRGATEKEVANQAHLDQMVAGQFTRRSEGSLACQKWPSPRLAAVTLKEDKEAAEEEEEVLLQASLDPRPARTLWVDMTEEFMSGISPFPPSAAK